MKSRVRYGLMASAFLSVGVLVGCWYQRSGANADRVEYRELEKFSKVLQLIESDFVEEKKTKDLVDGAVRGMLQRLDPHSAYMNAEVFREMKVETSGKFGGLGIEVSIKNGIITVVSPIDDTPAYRVGIKNGDRVIRIGDKSTKNMTLPEAVTLMRGKVGEPISISILRPGINKPFEYKLKRESIKIQSVRYARLPNNIGYVRISSFMERTSEDLAKALDKMSEKGKLEGVILDLRGNPGGLLDQAVRVSNIFIDEGPIVYTIGRDRTKKEIEYAQKGRQKTTAPMVVLVDGSSASASEIVSGALKDYGRAVIAGQRTFGKGSVQTIIPLGDESGLKITVARYYTPSGRSIQAKGILPDVELDEFEPKVLQAARDKARRFRESDLEGHFVNEDEDDDEDEAVIVADKVEKPTDKTPEKPAETHMEKAPDPSDVQEDPTLPLEERLKRDYMVIQAQGILRTMAVMTKGPMKPEFRMDEEPKKDAKAAKSDKAPSEKKKK